MSSLTTAVPLPPVVPSRGRRGRGGLGARRPARAGRAGAVRRREAHRQVGPPARRRHRRRCRSLFAVVLFVGSLALPAEERVRDLPLYDWIAVGALNVEFGLRIDPLSLTFALLITGVGSLIHIYSVGYMDHDPNRRKFFAQLNLFVAAMLVLVLGNGFVTLYLGWEGVGLASYLLIGFYTGRRSAGSAAKKAFLMNRVGDVGLALAIFILFLELGTTQYADVFARAGEISPGALTAITAAPAARRVRQVRPVPAAGLAARRHGGPDPGLGPHPRGDDGHRRRLPDRAVEPALRPRAGRPARRHDRRRDHAADRRDHRLRLRRHQEGPRLLHGQPDRLHDAGRRARPGRLRRGAGPPARPRLLQGGPVPRGRLGDARDGRRDRHAPVRRPPAPHAGDVLDVHPRLPGPDRLPVPVGLLHEGPHHRGRADRGPGGRLDPRRSRPCSRPG